MFQFRPFPSYTYLIQCTMSEYCSDGFPHSEIHGYSGYLLLPVAYRSLSRPSSAPDAKAFPLRSFQLDLFEIFGSHIVELCRQFNGSSLYRNCYPHLYDVPQLKQITFCCLAYHFSLCSVFKVRRRQKLRIVRRSASATPHSLRSVSFSSHKHFVGLCSEKGFLALKPD